MSDSSLTAKLVPYSSVVGQSIMLTQWDGALIAQLNVMAPQGPPPGVDHKTYVMSIAKLIADKINRTN